MARSASATDMIPFGGADEPLLHGGELGAARRLFPGAPEPFLDLSTGINPNPYPLPRLSPELFARLPDPDALASLAGVAAKAYGAPSAAHVVPAPGTQILLPLVAGLVRPGRAAILAPTYSEHARAAALAGHAVARSAISPGWPMPTSLLSPIPTIRTAGSSPRTIWSPSPRNCSRAAACSWSTKPSWMSGRPAAASRGEVSRGNIVVLRSFGKFFGLAGLRLGFALAAPPLAARLAALLGPWAVSAPALADRRAGPGGPGLDRRHPARLAIAAARLDAILTGCGLDIVGGTTLFRLARTRGGARIIPSSRPCRNLDARVSRPCHMAALWPAGGRAGLAAPANCDGCFPGQPLGSSA